MTDRPLAPAPERTTNPCRHASRVRIVTIDEVDLEEVLDLHHECFAYPLTAEALRRMRAADHRMPPRFGYYALEDGKLLGQVEVLEFDVETTEGKERVGGLWGICTRSDSGRQKISRTLVEATHAGFREQGFRYCLLTTSRAFVAHPFYHGLGYRDLTSYPWAIRRTRAVGAGPEGPVLRAPPASPPPETTLPDRITVSWATREDLPAIYWIYRQAVDGRLGFIHRPRDFIEVTEAWGQLTLENLALARRGDRIEAYALLRGTAAGSEIREILGNAEALPPLIRGLEDSTGGTHLMASTVFHPDARAVLQEAGFRLHDRSWNALMGICLDGSDASRLRDQLGIPAGAFQMAGLDLF